MTGEKGVRRDFDGLEEKVDRSRERKGKLLSKENLVRIIWKELKKAKIISEEQT